MSQFAAGARTIRQAISYQYSVRWRCQRKKHQQQAKVKIGNVSDISGNLNVAGGNVTSPHTTSDLSAAEIEQFLDKLYTAIETNKKVSPTKKEDLKAEVKEIQFTVTEAAKKNEKVDEGFWAPRFRNIGRMAPDVLDVVVATLGNPLPGLGTRSRR